MDVRYLTGPFVIDGKRIWYVPVRQCPFIGSCETIAYNAIEFTCENGRPVAVQSLRGILSKFDYAMLLSQNRDDVAFYATLPEAVSASGFSCNVPSPDGVTEPPQYRPTPYTAPNKNIDWRLLSAGALALILTAYLTYSYLKK